MSEPTHADDHGRSVRGQLAEGPAHRVVRREAGVGQRGRVCWLQTLREWHQMSSIGHQHVVRHPAIQSEAAATSRHRGMGHVLAVGLDTEAAPAARATPPGSVHGHRLTDLEPAHAFPKAMNPSGVLVAKGERRLPGQRVAAELVHEMKI